MNYFTSDLHFGHKAIIQFCNRPFQDLEHMKHSLLRNINSVITPKDILYILGDFSFLPSDNNVEIVKAIMCPVVLIRGNHDHSGSIKKCGFADVFDELDILIGDNVVTMSHFPFWVDSGTGTEIGGSGNQPDRYKERRPKNVGQWLLHGHTHDTGRIRREHKMIHVGTDAWQYSPISEIDIIKLING